MATIQDQLETKAKRAIKKVLSNPDERKRAILMGGLAMDLRVRGFKYADFERLAREVDPMLSPADIDDMMQLVEKIEASG